MRTTNAQRWSLWIRLRVVFWMGVWAVCSMAALVMLYRLPYKPTWTAFLFSPPGAVCVLALLGIVLSTVAVIGAHREVGANGNRSPRGLLISSMIVIGFLVVISEVVLRMATVRTSSGERLGRITMLPRGWSTVVDRYDRMLDSIEKTPNYFIGDPLLGWTVGPNRTSKDGLWHSSEEGLRSPTRGHSYRRGSSRCRVALLGDSFTFGWQGTFEETWGSYLQERLGPGCEVLNFAVPGYSISQMYLRYGRDVSPWRPDLVILSFTDGAPERGMGMYCFLMMDDWDCPWAAPRFVMKHERLELLNVPLPSPREIFGRRSIYDLPFIEFDRRYRRWQWEQPHWEPFYNSYLFRLATSLYPLYEYSSSEVSDEQLRRVSKALFRSFVDKMIGDNRAFLIVYLPGRSDYRSPREEPYSHGILREENITFLDATSCVGRVDPDRRFRSVGTHYSPEGERAVAECILAPARRALNPSQSS